MNDGRQSPPGRSEASNRKIDVRPIFILGLHRSGTTLLYQMLAATGHFNIVTARQVIHFDRLRRGGGDQREARQRLKKWFDDKGLSHREVDVVGLEPDTPEEYGFILEKLGVGLSISRRHFHVFGRMCDVLQSDGANGRPLLLKNPYDFGSGRLIRSLMPGAKLVYIHRYPFHVLSSIHRIVQKWMERPQPYLAALSDGYARLTQSEFPWRAGQWLAQQHPDWLVRALIGAASRQARGFLASIAHPTGRDRIDVRYEELCARPNETIGAILNYLGFSGLETDCSSMIGRRASAVDPVVARHGPLVVRRLSRYAEAVGYDLHSSLTAEMEPDQ